MILNVNLWQKNVTVGFNWDPVIEVKKKVRIYLKWIPYAVSKGQKRFECHILVSV